jgi:hypothetical protein
VVPDWQVHRCTLDEEEKGRKCVAGCPDIVLWEETCSFLWFFGNSGGDVCEILTTINYCEPENFMQRSKVCPVSNGNGYEKPGKIQLISDEIDITL